MSELAALRPRLSPILGERLDALWKKFRAEEPDGDASLFIARLRRDGLLSDDQIRDAFLGSEVVITLSEARPGTRRAAVGSTRYRELSRLGAGAMGEVVLAADPELRRHVALKRLHPHLIHDAALIRRFRTEAQITAQLDHPSIMTVFSFEIEPDGSMAYAMRLIRGHTLDEILHQARVAHQAGAIPTHLRLRARLEIFLSVCDAMAYAHDRGVIHRDLKPENIMVGAFHEITVMDWGIAKLISSDDDPVSSVTTGGFEPGDKTRFGLAIGTPCYMSPEQARGMNPLLDARSDQYALGLILHEIVSLRRANMADDVRVIVRRAQESMRDPLRPYSRLEPVPRELRAIIDRACAARPGKRYTTVAALAEDVRRYLRDEPITAAPDNILQKLNRWAGRNRGLLLGAVGGLVVLGALATSTAVVGGAVALGVQYVLAEQKREASERLLAKVAAQGQAMDATLKHYEALLTGLSYATEESLLREPEPGEIFFSDRFDAALRYPPDLAPSQRYGGPVSLDVPAIHVFNGSAGVDERAPLQLASVHPWMWRALIDSAPESARRSQAARREAVRGQGVPVVWVIVANDLGQMALLPGQGGIPTHIDPRVRPWYTGAANQRGVYWAKPYMDYGGMGLLVSASLALRDRDDAVIGVASFDLDIRHLVEDLMAPGDLVPTGAAAYLVDDEGRIFLDSTRPVTAEKDQQVERRLGPEIWTTLQTAGRTGQRETGGQLVSWVRLNVAPWTYVVVGTTGDMLQR